MKSVMLTLFVLATLLSAATSQAKPWLSSEFVDTPYKSVDLNRYCKRYGSSAYASLTGSHAYNWSCRAGTSNYSISVQRACEEQYGVTRGQAVLLGNHAYDWACIDWQAADNYVVPVVVIASEDYSNITAVNQAIQRVATLMSDTQSWYEDAMDSGKTFRMLRPIVRLSLKNSQFWNDMSCLSYMEANIAECDHLAGQPTEEGRYFHDVLAEVSPIFAKRQNGTDLVVSMFVSSHDAEPFWIGGGSNIIDGIEYNSQAPIQSTGFCHAEADCGIYTAGHELGHNLGLVHTCGRSPKPASCGSSIMQRPVNFLTVGMLVDEEQDELDASPFFF